MCIKPHNHEMWAVIGVYEGREDNVFWRRLKDDAAGKIEAAGAKDLGKGDTVPLGHDIIHSVLNPARKFTGAIHVYGGDFFDEPRSEWDPVERTERPCDVAGNMAHFQEEFERWKDFSG
jgi:predicted metal-dependent enzyme (double-stranded beta helix superfamily)